MPDKQPGADVDTVNRTTTWQWKPSYNGAATTIRVQVDLISWNDFRDGGMIRINCKLGKVVSLEVENVEGYFIE